MRSASPATLVCELAFALLHNMWQWGVVVAAAPPIALYVIADFLATCRTWLRARQLPPQRARLAAIGLQTTNGSLGWNWDCLGMRRKQHLQPLPPSCAAGLRCCNGVVAHPEAPAWVKQCSTISSGGPPVDCMVKMKRSLCFRTCSTSSHSACPVNRRSCMHNQSLLLQFEWHLIYWFSQGTYCLSCA